MGRSITAIIKPTHACNLACKYCYIDSNAEKGRMDSKTLENMTLGLLNLPGKERVHFLWHGGEPLLMGLDFYREAIELQKRFGAGKEIVNSMQSNVTLVNNEVLDFAEENDIQIGTSLDGPKDVNDLTRVYPNGRGAFDDIWMGIKAMRQRNAAIRSRTPKGVKPVYLGGGAIVVLNRKNISHLDEIYEFFRDNDLSIKINPLIKSGKAKTDYEDLGIGRREYGEALVKLFDVWFKQTERIIDIDPLTEILGNLMTGQPSGCSFEKSCRDGFISIGPQGDVYPCGRFDGVEEYHLGNVNNNSLLEMIQSKKHVGMDRGAENVSGCSSCNYKQICNAGCMHNAYMQRGKLNDKDYYCASYKMLFGHLENALQSELEKARAPSKMNRISLPILNELDKSKSMDMKGGDCNGNC